MGDNNIKIRMKVLSGIKITNIFFVLISPIFSLDSFLIQSLELFTYSLLQ